MQCTATECVGRSSPRWGAGICQSDKHRQCYPYARHILPIHLWMRDSLGTLFQRYIVPQHRSGIEIVLVPAPLGHCSSGRRPNFSKWESFFSFGMNLLRTEHSEDSMRCLPAGTRLIQFTAIGKLLCHVPDGYEASSAELIVSFSLQFWLGALSDVMNGADAAKPR